MKPIGLVFALALCLCAAACNGSSTPQPAPEPGATGAESKPTPEGPETTALIPHPSPYIADGYPAVMTDTDSPSFKTIYGDFHGDASNDPLAVEQCFLVKTPDTISGLKLVEFPNTLPLAEAKLPENTVYW